MNDRKWHPEIESQGRLARLYGFDIESQNPHEIDGYCWKSFRAGWFDVDQDPDAPKQDLRHAKQSGVEADVANTEPCYICGDSNDLRPFCSRCGPKTPRSLT